MPNFRVIGDISRWMCYFVYSLKLNLDSPHSALWKNAEHSRDTLPGRSGRSDTAPCHHPGLLLTNESGEGSSHGPWSHDTTGNRNKEVMITKTLTTKPKWIQQNSKLKKRDYVMLQEVDTLLTKMLTWHF